MKNFIIILSLFIFSSCANIKKTDKKDYHKQIADIYQERLNLFPKSSKKEIRKRKNKLLPTFNHSWNNNDSVAAIIKSSIIDSINNDKKFIEVDLRHYKSVELGNIMFSAIKDKNLDNFLYFSKFDQQFFILFNFSPNKVTIVNGKQTPYDFKTFYIQGNAQDKEIVFNVNNAKSLQCNIKFTPQKPTFSLLANNIQSAPCDIREISNALQNFLYNITTLDYIGGDWKMKLLSLKKSQYSYDGARPKFTFGSIENIMNKDIKKLEMGVFKNMNIIRYYNNNGKKFKYKRRSD